jgi:hypothetical protein
MFSTARSATTSISSGENNATRAMPRRSVRSQMTRCVTVVGVAASMVAMAPSLASAQVFRPVRPIPVGGVVPTVPVGPTQNCYVEATLNAGMYQAPEGNSGIIFNWNRYSTFSGEARVNATTISKWLGSPNPNPNPTARSFSFSGGPITLPVGTAAVSVRLWGNLNSIDNELLFDGIVNVPVRIGEVTNNAVSFSSDPSVRAYVTLSPTRSWCAAPIRFGY